MGLTNEYDQSGAGLYTDQDGKTLDSMLIVGERPWHFTQNQHLIKLVERGTKVPVQELNKAAGLDWDVANISEREWLEGMGVPADVAAKAVLATDYVNVRSDTNGKIGNVKRGYTLFQNNDAPQFMMDLVDSGELEVETAFSLYGGRRVVWTFKLPEAINIEGVSKEDIETFLCLMNSHDGSVAITLFVTPIRVLCQNTLGYGLSKAKRTMRIRHTKNSHIKFEEARRAMGIGFKFTQELAWVAGQMVQTSFSDSDFEQFLQTLVPVPEPTFVNGKQRNQPAITMAKDRHEAIFNVYKKHPSQSNIYGSLWGGVQAVQFYNDHIASVKSATKKDESGTPRFNPETRLSSLIRAQNVGTEAFTLAQECLSMGMDLRPHWFAPVPA